MPLTAEFYHIQGCFVYWHYENNFYPSVPMRTFATPMVAMFSDTFTTNAMSTLPWLQLMCIYRRHENKCYSLYCCRNSCYDSDYFNKNCDTRSNYRCGYCAYHHYDNGCYTTVNIRTIAMLSVVMFWLAVMTLPMVNVCLRCHKYDCCVIEYSCNNLYSYRYSNNSYNVKGGYSCGCCM